MLVELKNTGKTLAVATGKARAGLDRVFGATGLAPLFSTTRTADDAKSKPHPDMLEQILAETGIDADKALMIGDSVLDIGMAKAAGIRAMGVTFGVHGGEKLKAAGADALIDDWRGWALA